LQQQIPLDAGQEYLDTQQNLTSNEQVPHANIEQWFRQRYNMKTSDTQSELSLEHIL
jgi:hypothetical protein